MSCIRTSPPLGMSSMRTSPPLRTLLHKPNAPPHAQRASGEPGALRPQAQARSTGCRRTVQHSTPEPCLLLWPTRTQPARSTASRAIPEGFLPRRIPNLQLDWLVVDCNPPRAELYPCADDSAVTTSATRELKKRARAHHERRAWTARLAPVWAPSPSLALVYRCTIAARLPPACSHPRGRAAEALEPTRTRTRTHRAPPEAGAGGFPRAASPPPGPRCLRVLPGGGQPIAGRRHRHAPIVRSWTGWKRLSVNCSSRHDLPTPVSPMMMYLNRYASAQRAARGVSKGRGIAWHARARATSATLRWRPPRSATLRCRAVRAHRGGYGVRGQRDAGAAAGHARGRGTMQRART
jgi:hypothetical protein